MAKTIQTHPIMKYPVSLRLPGIALGLSAAMAGNAMAHPGHHGATAAAHQWIHDVLHFFTHIDHVAPVIVCLMILVTYRHRNTLMAFAKRQGSKPSGKH
jgi:hypothetical protein